MPKSGLGKQIPLPDVYLCAMKNGLLRLVIAFWGGLVFLAACEGPLTPYALEKPKRFPPIPAQPVDNPLTVEGIALGKALFYDPKLSANGQVSCATCHQPERAFSDGMALSTLGASHIALKRHTPSLINLAWQPNFFWDGGATSLEAQVLGPMTGHDEMGLSVKEISQKVARNPTYVQAIRRVFGVDTVHPVYIFRALAQFERTLISANSPYDRWMAGKLKPSLDQKRGFQLFNQFCSSCHAGDLFTDFRFANIGLDADLKDSTMLHHNLGRFRITHDSADLGAYRVPGLRNIALTAPYMHDGRFKTLEEVMRFYVHEVQPVKNLDEDMKTEGRPGLDLSDEEQAQIISFLHLLTDSSFITHPAYRP